MRSVYVQTHFFGKKNKSFFLIVDFQERDAEPVG